MSEEVVSKRGGLWYDGKGVKKVILKEGWSFGEGFSGM